MILKSKGGSSPWILRWCEASDAAAKFLLQDVGIWTLYSHEMISE